MISISEIAWAAGLLEGEGSFIMSDRAITIAVNMVDRDVIERIASLLGGQAYGPLDRSHVKPWHQPIWRAQLKGPNAAGWMMTIFPCWACVAAGR